MRKLVFFSLFILIFVSCGETEKDISTVNNDYEESSSVTINKPPVPPSIVINVLETESSSSSSSTTDTTNSDSTTSSDSDSETSTTTTSEEDLQINPVPDIPSLEISE
jgi:cytoskeletal protein RodZ